MHIYFISTGNNKSDANFKAGYATNSDTSLFLYKEENFLWSNKDCCFLI